MYCLRKHRSFDVNSDILVTFYNAVICGPIMFCTVCQGGNISKFKQGRLVSQCFKPSQPQRITSGPNTNFTLSPSQSFHKSSYHKVMVFQPIYIPWALNTGTCIQQGDLFYSAGLHRTMCQPQPTQGKIGRGFGKNAGEWTGSVEISKKEIPGSKRNTYSYILTYSRL